MSEYVTELNESDFDQAVMETGKVVLVDFWAPWCGPCRTLEPIIDAIAEQYAGHARVVKLNVDDHPGVLQRYGIQVIPTLILFENREEKDRIIGAASRDTIARAIEARMGAALN